MTGERLDELEDPFFAWRRGHSYGSILVDPECCQVLDLPSYPVVRDLDRVASGQPAC